MRKSSKKNRAQRKSNRKTKRHGRSSDSAASANRSEGAPLADEQIYQVVDYLKKGKHSSAERLLRKSLRTQPKDFNALHLLGVTCCQQAGEAKQLEGLGFLKKAVELKTDDDETHYFIGIALNNLHRFEEAISSFRHALKINPNSVDIHNALGMVLNNLKRPEEAISSFSYILSVQPNSAETHTGIGISLNQLCRYDDAIGHLRRAVELGPNSFEANMQLGIALEETGRLDEATSRYQSLLDICENPVQASRILLKLSGLPDGVSGFDLVPHVERLRDGKFFGEKAKEERDFQHRLAFSLANELHKQNRFDETWSQLVAVNSELDALYEEEYRRSLEQDALALDRAEELVCQTPMSADIEKESPISLFILGPSRAGKTTLERLVGRIDGVQPGYEIPIVRNSAKRAEELCGHNIFEYLSNTPIEVIKQFRDVYDNYTKNLIRNNNILTNTLPSTISDVGWISSAIPAARFVFLERNIDDNVLSIFMKFYSKDGNFYAYKIDKIHKYISWYTRLIDVWMKKLPKQCIRLSYEDVISRPEQCLAEIAKLCELELPDIVVSPLKGDIGIADPYRSYMKSGS